MFNDSCVQCLALYKNYAAVMGDYFEGKHMAFLILFPHILKTESNNSTVGPHMSVQTLLNC
jgi:hypothetical protein